MASTKCMAEKQNASPIFVVSGGMGATGELLARTVLAQFKQANVPINIKAHIHEPHQVADAVMQAAQAGGLIVHTMVNDARRQNLSELAAEQNVPAFDIAGPLLAHLSRELGQEPLGEPGLYRRLHAAYYDRIAAIDFAVAHDDGKRVEDLPDAEIVLIGASRVGKTPLSMYLSMLGWKVANIPLVMEVPPPDELFMVDRARVFGLTIEPSQLLRHRQSRRPHLGIDRGAYFNRNRIAEELRAANHLFYKHKYTVIDVTDKPIETTSEEIIGAVSRIS